MKALKWGYRRSAVGVSVLALNCGVQPIEATRPLQAQSLYEIWKVKPFYALFDRKACRNSENRIPQLVCFAPVVKQTRLEERVEQQRSD
jgi:hypothetical protein